MHVCMCVCGGGVHMYHGTFVEFAWQLVGGGSLVTNVWFFSAIASILIDFLWNVLTRYSHEYWVYLCFKVSPHSSPHGKMLHGFPSCLFDWHLSFLQAPPHSLSIRAHPDNCFFVCCCCCFKIYFLFMFVFLCVHTTSVDSGRSQRQHQILWS